MAFSDVVVRPMVVADYGSIVTIWNQVMVNEMITEEQMRFDDELNVAPRLWGRTVAERGGSIIGSAMFYQAMGMYHPQKFRIDIFVAPADEGAGVGSLLYSDLMQRIDAFDPISVRANVSEGHPYAFDFAERRGFVTDKTDWVLEVKLATWDPTPHLHLLERCRGTGIAIASIDEVGATDSTYRAFFDAFTVARMDVPRSEPATPLTWEQFQQSVAGGPDFLPHATFLAFDEDQLVGFTMSWTAADPPELHTGLTAVLAAHRGRGIATALKVAALVQGKADGRTRAITDNDNHNVEMLAVNEKLGYVKQQALFSMVRRIA